MKRVLCLTHHVRDVAPKSSAMTILDITDYPPSVSDHRVDQSTLFEVCGRYSYCAHDCSMDITVSKIKG